MQQRFSTCNATMLHCKLKKKVARIPGLYIIILINFATYLIIPFRAMIPYIGQTKRQFRTRLREHHLSKKENSALSEHACVT